MGYLINAKESDYVLLNYGAHKTAMDEMIERHTQYHIHFWLLSHLWLLHQLQLLNHLWLFIDSGFHMVNSSSHAINVFNNIEGSSPAILAYMPKPKASMPPSRASKPPEASSPLPLAFQPPKASMRPWTFHSHSATKTTGKTQQALPWFSFAAILI
jgi:hypothetical protein